MARTEQIKCDVCGKVKGEANHWLELWINPTGWFANFNFNINTIEKQRGNQKDFCGQDCLIKEIQRLLSGAQGQGKVKLTDDELCQIFMDSGLL